MYIRNKRMQKSKKHYYVIEGKVYENGKYVTKNVKYLGTAEKVLKNLEELAKLRKSMKKPKNR